jgi:hypothetical protein
MHKRREANTSSPRIPGRAQRDRSLFRATKVMCRLSHIIDTIRIAGSTYDFDGCAAAEPYRLSGLSASTVKFLCKIILGLHEGDVCCGGCTLATWNVPSWSWSCFQRGEVRAGAQLEFRQAGRQAGRQANPSGSAHATNASDIPHLQQARHSSMRPRSSG